MVTAVSTTCGILKGLLLSSRQRRLMTLIAVSTTNVVRTAAGLRTAKTLSTMTAVSTTKAVRTATCLKTA